jgi:hypothetical protein
VSLQRFEPVCVSAVVRGQSTYCPSPAPRGSLVVGIFFHHWLMLLCALLELPGGAEG